MLGCLAYASSETLNVDRVEIEVHIKMISSLDLNIYNNQIGHFFLFVINTHTFFKEARWFSMDEIQLILNKKHPDNIYIVRNACNF